MHSAFLGLLLPYQSLRQLKHAMMPCRHKFKACLLCNPLISHSDSSHMPCRHKFKATIVKLVYVAAACGVLSGIRGGLFTVAMSKLNVRIRKTLFAALVNVSGGAFAIEYVRHSNTIGTCSASHAPAVAIPACPGGLCTINIAVFLTHHFWPVPYSL